MPDYYQVPALVLTALLVPAFAYLYLRFRDTRTLLWLLGYSFAVVRMALLTRLGSWDFQEGPHPWLATAGQTSILLSSALFLASLSPLRFWVGRFQILYVIPYTAPLIVYSVILFGLMHGKPPQGPLFLIFPVLGMLTIVAGFFWAVRKGTLPKPIGVFLCIAGGAMGLWACYALGPRYALALVETSNHLLTALLVVYTFRRLSSGMFLSVIGFLLWSAPVLLLLPIVSNSAALDLGFTRAIIMGKVVAAMGMILLALEDQLAINQGAQERERRARRELEAYINLILSRRRVDDFDHQATEVCETVVAHSRFSQAALVLQSGGRYRLAVSLPVESFLAEGTAAAAVGQSKTLALDLSPWLRPGDDLKRLHFTSVLAVPMRGRSVTEGALLLAGMRPSAVRAVQSREPGEGYESLRTDDLLPIEMLTARLQATRSQTMMLEKLIDSEKFAGLGQLAGNVTQQLNNPLTVILGYASLLEETLTLDPQERRGIESILTEARRMRATLESLTRISRPQSGQFTAVSVAEMLTDMEQLHRSEFLQRSIEFRLSLAPGLPRVRCHAQQLRQAVLHCLQFAIEAVENKHLAGTGAEVKTVRLEASATEDTVRIFIAHSGAPFLHPDRAFDPFVPAQATGETVGLGLSLCATILRDQNGRATAMNLEPRGAAIILELKAA